MEEIVRESKDQRQDVEVCDDTIIAPWAQSWVEYFQRDAARVNAEVRQLRERLQHAAAALEES